MDLFKQGMKGPSRSAPSVPGAVNRYSPVTNWNDDPFEADVFEPTPQYTQKKQPPPRPPPPKVTSKHHDAPLKPSHFIRRPTVLSSLLSRKNKAASNTQNTINLQTSPAEQNTALDTHKMFPKCEPRNMQTGALIDLSSPPSSPTFTTRSSSDGLSVDSFGSDATTSTNQHNPHNGGNASQAESGFEDDFELFLHSRKAISKEDSLDDFASIDPFSSQTVKKHPIMKIPSLSKDLFDIQLETKNMSSSINHQTAAPLLKGPTIIRAKPARPKPPDNSVLLKNTFGDAFPVTSMNINTTIPIQKICNGFGDSFDSKPFNVHEEGSPERDSSPPMPSVPPPPPPLLDDAPLGLPADADAVCFSQFSCNNEEPYAIALFDYFTDHPDDLCFSANSRISLIRRIDEEWLYGRVSSGAEGVFPANYVDVRAPLPHDAPPPARFGLAAAIYDFEPAQPGDLRFRAGDSISIMYKINDEWYFGECNGGKGQFPANYVEII